jgi:hypothetical protein
MRQVLRRSCPGPAGVPAQRRLLSRQRTLPSRLPQRFERAQPRSGGDAIRRADSGGAGGRHSHLLRTEHDPRRKWSAQRLRLRRRGRARLERLCGGGATGGPGKHRAPVAHRLQPVVERPIRVLAARARAAEARSAGDHLHGVSAALSEHAVGGQDPDCVPRRAVFRPSAPSGYCTFWDTIRASRCAWVWSL